MPYAKKDLYVTSLFCPDLWNGFFIQFLQIIFWFLLQFIWNEILICSKFKNKSFAFLIPLILFLNAREQISYFWKETLHDKRVIFINNMVK